MKVITLHLPDHLLDLIDELVMKGIYPSRSEFIRDAIRFYLRNHFNVSSFILKERKKK